MGLITWGTNANSREFIGIQLALPLVIGQKYFLSFYTVMVGSVLDSIFWETPTNNIGIRLSTIAFSPSVPAPIDNFAHLRSTTIITDTVTWVRISGSITADSTYSHLILGNFYDDANTDTITLNCGTCLNYYGYYLVDDICVSTDSSFCNGGIDVLPCDWSTGEQESASISEAKVYPNPASDHLEVLWKSAGARQLAIYDLTGRVWQKQVNDQTLSIEVDNWPRGQYFLEEQNDKGRQVHRFVLM